MLEFHLFCSILHLFTGSQMKKTGVHMLTNLLSQKKNTPKNKLIQKRQNPGGHQCSFRYISFQCFALANQYSEIGFHIYMIRFQGDMYISDKKKNTGLTSNILCVA